MVPKVDMVSQVVEPTADDDGTLLFPEKREQESGHGSLRSPRHGRRSSVGQSTLLGAVEVIQLPSPLPSPSQRSSSPSLVVTDSSREYTGSLSSVTNGHQYSSSFEKAVFGPASNDRDHLILSPPFPILKEMPSHELHAIPEEKVRKARKLSLSKNVEGLKLSASEIEELTSALQSLPVASAKKMPISEHPSLAPSPIFERRGSVSDASHLETEGYSTTQRRKTSASDSTNPAPDLVGDHRNGLDGPPTNGTRNPLGSARGSFVQPASSGRVSSYTKPSPNTGQVSPKRKPLPPSARPEPLDFSHASTKAQNATNKASGGDPPSPIPQSIPLPPMSIPTYLQLELSSTRPSPLYIYRSAASEFPYESSRIKFERLLNFLLLPPQLEHVLYFGTLACLDAWLYTFTILPLRFFKALAILIQWWGQILAREARFISGFIYHGSGRMWHRQRERRASVNSSSRSRSVSRVRRRTLSTAPSYQNQAGRNPENDAINASMDQLKAGVERKSRQGWGRRHRRTKSHPSSLSSYHKADLLQGAVVVCSCMILMKLDASRMYHSIRGQSAMKLYVIYNVLEVCDKLLSALGQDILECLFSNETLERNVNGRSKILRPMGMFVLALIYNVVHAASLFYQVITLNVAVNSYSNALLTLLLSNQFVEIKSTVFKKIEKDNLFQLTCADIVERFQLWLMLMIIALRNIVEVGGLSILSAAADGDFMKDTPKSNSIIPNSFTILPGWTGEVLSPFVLVLGSEMLVDWIKHAYTNKFNNVKPAIYQRYLDVLAKDYYTNAFVNQNLVKRLGLPVIPLSCLFIRSSIQTYNMFLATHLPSPITSTATSLSVDSTTTSPATTAALEQFDNIIRRALGGSTFAIPYSMATNPWYLPSPDDVIAALTMLVFFLGAFLVLLACKLVLGMLLLKFSRSRYRSMKKREHQSYDTQGKRLGGWGMTEVDDDKKRWIYDDDLEKLRKLKEKEKAWKEKNEKGVGSDFEKISRYELVKRIW